jgi:hypothetical protein
MSNGSILFLSRAWKGDILKAMQGHIAYPVKPAFFRPYPPEFPAGSSVFPGRGRVVIFIFFSRENPVKFTDPDGKAIWIPLLIIAAAAVVTNLTSCQPEKTGLPYEPRKWNDGGTIQKITNCYAYALNLQHNPITGRAFPMHGQDGFALQPGDLANVSADPFLLTMNGAYVIGLATMDAKANSGTFENSGKNDQVAKGNWKVALVLAPGRDYHWYRQNDDGTWSHKREEDPVTNRDNSGQIITDPERANRGIYTQFVGYFEVGP